MTKSKSLFFVASLLLSSCANKIIYYGREYQPTENVDIYFRESDVIEPTEIMGKVTLEMSVKKSSDKVQKKLMNRAKGKGADAIIFDEVALTNTGSTTGAAAAGAGVRRGFLGIFGSKTKFSKGQMVKGTLLKYKKNINH